MIDEDKINILGILLFPIIALIIGPLLHEYMHSIVLFSYNCEHSIYYSFFIEQGITAKVNIYCMLDKFQYFVVYLAGVLFTFTIGFALILLGYIRLRLKNTKYSIFFSAIGIGFLYSVMNYFFSDSGDLIEMLRILNFEKFFGLLPIIGVLFYGILTIYLIYLIKENLLHANDTMLNRKNNK